MSLDFLELFLSPNKFKYQHMQGLDEFISGDIIDLCRRYDSSKVDVKRIFECLNLDLPEYKPRGTITCETTSYEAPKEQEASIFDADFYDIAPFTHEPDSEDEDRLLPEQQYQTLNEQEEFMERVPLLSGYDHVESEESDQELDIRSDEKVENANPNKKAISLKKLSGNRKARRKQKSRVKRKMRHMNRTRDSSDNETHEISQQVESVTEQVAVAEEEVVAAESHALMPLYLQKKEATMTQEELYQRLFPILDRFPVDAWKVSFNYGQVRRWLDQRFASSKYSS
jgi:hypothetical protein